MPSILARLASGPLDAPKPPRSRTSCKIVGTRRARCQGEAWQTRQGTAAPCAKDSVGPTDRIADPLEPQQPQQCPAVAVAPVQAAAAAADGITEAKATPRRSERKRSQPDAASSVLAPGPDAAPADAAVPPAAKPSPRRSGRGRRSKGDATPAEDAAAAAEAQPVTATAAGDAGPSSNAGPTEAAGAGPLGAPADGAPPQAQEQPPVLPEQPPGQEQGLPGQQQAAAGGAASLAEQAQLDAAHNRTLARQAVAAASKPGAPPLELSALLVEPSWREALADQIEGPKAPLKPLEAFLYGEWKAARKPIYPPEDCIFQAFNACPFDKVRVVILGQDPYHGPRQAMGLAFSVASDCPLPPSLVNIYKEAAEDLGWQHMPRNGDLTAWSVQGVLLLNTCLTVRQGEANSHSKKGWEQFTDAAIRALSQRRTGLVFLLWGNPAQAKAALVDTRKHHVLKAAHPSPLSVSRGFKGCRHFSKANKLLADQGLPPIDWMPS